MTKAAGLARKPPRPYLGTMRFRLPWMPKDLDAPISPVGAIADLRAFLGRKRKHDIVFLTAAIGLTFLIMYGFVIEMKGKPQPYERKIIYFKQWDLTRSDDQIKAQQAIDKPAQDAREKQEREDEARQRAIYKKLGDQMNAIGLY
ncbi:hypothetical protein [Sphingomonas immobilis]|uniref:Uncharacterized protein n=1 Tax=Sphingomonas immobilis TaxID=3063997 RepID=A0ABT8ZVR3_9SPHN|nr:hypothetical protein [Sphingomonas sp. CA1-15]MDO7841368.1 hypothetical protein [Sphingomonas sp. CA1-15]